MEHHVIWYQVVFVECQTRLVRFVQRWNSVAQEKIGNAWWQLSLLSDVRKCLDPGKGWQCPRNWWSVYCHRCAVLKHCEWCHFSPMPSSVRWSESSDALKSGRRRLRHNLHIWSCRRHRYDPRRSFWPIGSVSKSQFLYRVCKQYRWRQSHSGVWTK